MKPGVAAINTGVAAINTNGAAINTGALASRHHEYCTSEPSGLLILCVWWTFECQEHKEKRSAVMLAVTRPCRLCTHY